MRDPYVILGIARGATSAQIKDAYRRQVKRHHPDTGGDGGIKLRLVYWAYEALSERHSVAAQEWAWNQEIAAKRAAAPPPPPPDPWAGHYHSAWLSVNRDAPGDRAAHDTFNQAQRFEMCPDCQAKQTRKQTNVKRAQQVAIVAQRWCEAGFAGAPGSPAHHRARRDLADYYYPDRRAEVWVRHLARVDQLAARDLKQKRQRDAARATKAAGVAARRFKREADKGLKQRAPLGYDADTST